jgi:hypothetical protein
MGDSVLDVASGSGTAARLAPTRAGSGGQRGAGGHYERRRIHQRAREDPGNAPNSLRC